MTVTYPLRLFLDCSTAHLSAASRAYLERGAGSEDDLVAATPYGWFLWAGGDPADDVPVDLAGIIAHAQRLDADYILFDRDAPENELLPVFDWSG